MTASTDNPTVPAAVPAAPVPSPAHRRKGLGSKRITLHGVRWTTYVTMVNDPAFRRLRLTYDRGDLEIMSPSSRHEKVTKVLARMLEMMAFLVGVPVEGYRSTTFKLRRRRAGLEPDECYYIAHSAGMADRVRIDLSRDPPPDLVIETDITNSSIDKEPLYAKFRVPEIWRYDGDRKRLVFLRLESNRRYVPADRSLSFPFLAASDLMPFLARLSDGEDAVMRAFNEFVRVELLGERIAKP
jgi:Uma2 family endonuclease